MACGSGYVFNPRTRVIGEGYRFNPHTGVIEITPGQFAPLIEMSECGDDVVVTNHQPREPRPDSTAAQDAAEDRAHKTIQDLDGGLVTRRTAIRVKHAAKRAVGGHDLSGSFEKL